MFTNNRLPQFRPTGDWLKDGPIMHRWLHEYFLSLEKKGALQPTAATLFSTDALEDEGTSWTPVITAATVGDLSVSFASGVQIGEYHKIGGLYIVHFRLTTSTFTHTTAAGDLQITGLPATAATLTSMAWLGGSLEFSGLTKATYTQFTPRVASADNKILIRACGSGVAAATTAITDLPTGGAVVLNGTVIYRV